MAMAVLVLSLPLLSQTSQGNIQGTVVDQSGGAIAGAMVTVTDVARGVTRTLTTDSAGAYVAPNLNPGMYTVKAASTGFQTVEHSNIQVEVATNIRVDFNLQPGAQTQTITVTSEVPSIDTTDATLGGTVNNQEINSLPLNGRNFERLLELRPGVVPTVGAGTGLTSSNGLRAGENMTMVEGLVTIAPLEGGDIMNSQYHQGDATSLLPLDAIQEFNVQSNPKAEYGWKDGSVQNVGVKSGTNNIHGTAYAFGRDDAWDASNYFTGAPVPMALKQYGSTAGGPLIKDKFFWFLGFEGLNYQVGNSNAVSIPSDYPSQLTSAQDPGNSLSMFDACNAIETKNNTQAANPALISALSAQLAGLNTATCGVSPSSSTFENLFTYDQAAPSGAAVKITPALTTDNPIYNGVAKLDYNLNSANHLAGMFFIGYQNATVQTASSQIQPYWLVLSYSRVEDGNGSWVYTPNSAWVNELRAGRVLQTLESTSADGTKLVSAPWPGGYGLPTGVTLNTPAGIGAGGLPQISITGFTGSLGEGNQRGVRGPLGTDDILDHVSYLRGKHAFKFGFEFLNEHGNNNSYSVGAGDLTFSNLQNFLTGTLNTGQIFVGNALEDTRARSYAGFFQDDWRVKPRLTLNLGVRYELNLPLHDLNDYMANFNPNVNPLTTSAIQLVGGPGQPPFYHEQRDNFAPRAGFAWDVKGNGKTVVRGGVFVMFNQMPPGLLEGSPTNPFAANVPSIGFNAGASEPAFSANTPYRVTLAGNLLNWNTTGPVYPVFPQTLTTTGTYAGTYTGPSCTYLGEPGLPANFTAVPCNFPAAAQPDLSTPRAYEWTLDFQRAITNSLSVEVGYVGNHSDSMSQQDINQPPMGWGWNNPTSALPTIFNGAAKALPGGVSPAAYCLASAGDAKPYDQCSGNTLVKAALAPNEEAGQVYFSQFPYLSYINQDQNRDYSNYNSLQVTATQRLNHGLTFLAGYTYSKALGLVTGGIAGGSPSDIRNLKANYGPLSTDGRNRFTFSATYAVPGIKAPAQMLQGWSTSFIVAAFSGTPTTANDTTDDLQGTGEKSNNAAAPEYWNYSGPPSAFNSAPNHYVPCYGVMTGCTPYVNNTPPAVCISAAQAPYAPGSQLQQLALAALYNIGCYVQGGGVLTPPAYGTIGNAGQGFFHGPAFYNVDMTVQKDWKFRERYTAQFRAEFFNLLNRADFTGGGGNPAGGQFDCSCSTPDAAGTNSVLGSGGARAIQFGLKLVF